MTPLKPSEQLLSALTDKDKQAHADGQDGAGTERGHPLTFDLPQLTAVTPEALLTAALVTVGGERMAYAAITTGRRTAG